MWKSAHPKAPIFSPCNPLHHRVVLNTLADTCQHLYQSLHDPRVFYPNSSIINPNKLERSKFLGHCSAPTHSKHPAEKKHLQLRFGPQVHQPKDSFGLASDLMVSTEPFFSSWGLASPLPPFPPFPPLGRWVCDGPFWGPRPDHATAWISMYKVFTRQTHTNSC